jgi:hypothetical protein
MRVLTMIKASEQLGEPPVAFFEAMEKDLPEIDATITMIDTNALLPSAAAGALVRSSGGRTTVLDGPFTEAKELVAGFYLIQAKSREEAIEWAKRAPVHVALEGRDDRTEAVVEVRQVGDAEDLPEITPEQIEAEQRLRQARQA